MPGRHRVEPSSAAEPSNPKDAVRRVPAAPPVAGWPAGPAVPQSAPAQAAPQRPPGPPAARPPGSNPYGADPYGPNPYRVDPHRVDTKTGTDKAVVVDGLKKSFGSVTALRGISFEVEPGEVLALLGPNGAGKTTTVDILSTLATPDSGRAVVAGHDVRTDPAAVRRSIMLTGQHVALDDMLTGRQNLVMFGRLQGLKKSVARRRAAELLERFDLVGAADRSVKHYSGGMRRRIDIACGLVVRPEVVFLDEPTTGLDPRSRLSIWELVSDFKRAGIATLLTTQYLEEADSLSDRIIVIDRGAIIAEGTADQLKERTGGTYCEIVPRDMKDIPALVAVLGGLLPAQNRAGITDASDRISMPAPDGANTLIKVLNLVNAANIDLLDIALRRPSLDEVFLRLTGKDGAADDSPTTVPNPRLNADALR